MPPLPPNDGDSTRVLLCLSAHLAASRLLLSLLPTLTVASPDRSGARVRGAGGRGSGDVPGEESMRAWWAEGRMGNPCGGLDEQIEQLLQCKPLVEHEVPLVSPPPGCSESWVLDFVCFWGGFGLPKISFKLRHYGRLAFSSAIARGSNIWPPLHEKKLFESIVLW
ncbi:uncharacterized protein [Aegilops tauschii subsp. strangulata]|uniref:uncharacterized protein isoform X2 n=1 Tax=Aegilops tauschii subsp. strangulata TaxID=200361 RepID=UPI00098B4858|nr:uncharacterized protein LOC109785886 isoform X3 [Aegilops tauschii subsp. strangulata]